MERRSAERIVPRNYAQCVGLCMQVTFLAEQQHILVLVAHSNEKSLESNCGSSHVKLPVWQQLHDILSQELPS